MHREESKKDAVELGRTVGSISSGLGVVHHGH